MESTTEEPSHRWIARPWVARAIRALVYVVPFGASVVAAVLIGRSIPAASSGVASILRFVGVAALSTGVLIVVDRITRRLLPLAALLDLTLLFPDHAPSRYKVALRSTSVSQLQRRLDEYQSTGAGEPALAAERLLGLVASLRDHDRLTRGHSERVRAYSQMIGEEMGFSGVELDRLRWASLVHDVGKLRIDPAILNKPGRLTDDEFEIIKQHPQFGAELAAPLAEWLGDSVLAVVQHHERWDGRGYPAGLARDEISLPARIVAVADTFDVVTSVRSYKTAHTPVWARAELTRCAGSQFDPAVVRAFLGLSLGKLRMVMGPLSWVAQLALVPKSFLAGAAAPTANALVALTGVAAATMGAVADVGAARDEPVPNPPAAVAVGKQRTAAPGDVVEIGSDGSSAGDDNEPVADDGQPGDPPLDAVDEDAAADPTATVSTTARRPSDDSNTDAPGQVGGGSSTTVARGVGQAATTTSAPRGGPVAATTTVADAPLPPPSPTVTTTTTTTVPAPPTTVAPSTTTTTVAPTTTSVAPRLTGTWLLGSSAAGAVVSQDVLPLVGRAPLNVVLPNYDTDRDSQAGLSIRRDGALTVGDRSRLQRFRLPSPASASVDGRATSRLYVAPAGLLIDQMSITVGLVHCQGAAPDSCTVLATRTRAFTGLFALYQAVDVDFGVVQRTLPSGDALELWIVADATSSRELWLAYDTAAYQSTLTLS